MSTYPANSYSSPADIPATYYQSMSVYRGSGEPLFMLETGWPTYIGDTVDRQVQFIGRFAQLFRGMNTAIIAWSLLHDVPTTYMPPFLATTGLRTMTGQAKPSWQSFLKLRPTAVSSQ